MFSSAAECVPCQTAVSHLLVDQNDVQVIHTSGLASTEQIDRNDDRKGDGNGCLVYARKGHYHSTIRKKME